MFQGCFHIKMRLRKKKGAVGHSLGVDSIIQTASLYDASIHIPPVQVKNAICDLGCNWLPGNGSWLYGKPELYAISLRTITAQCMEKNLNCLLVSRQCSRTNVRQFLTSALFHLTLDMSERRGVLIVPVKLTSKFKCKYNKPTSQSLPVQKKMDFFLLR